MLRRPLKYPIGIETFSEIREGGYVYVDKTQFVHRLAAEGKYYFLSRPRRFGKSLLLSTIEAFFEGRRDLFAGLYIDTQEVDWTPSPVFRLNFVNLDPGNSQSLIKLVDRHLKEWESVYGCKDPEQDLQQRFYNVIEMAYTTTGRRVAVLIDEYDRALVHNINTPTLQEEMKGMLRPLFSVLKAADKYIAFGMITGVSRFSKLSLFSDLNNLKDISLSEKYNAICGISEDELRHTLADGVSAFAEARNINFETMTQLLKENYDGYHFSKNSEDLYNPFGLLRSLDEQELGHYWFATATPTFLVKKIQNSGRDLRSIFQSEASTIELESMDATDSSLKAILYQTGYLTIKRYDSTLGIYELGIPNKEVEKGLFNVLLPSFTGHDSADSNSLVIKLSRAAMAGDADSLMRNLQSFMADIPYDLTLNKPEIYFENNLYIIFKLLGFYISTEYRTSNGRIDILISTPDYIYVIELKLNGTAQEALTQIRSKHYATPFESDHRKIITVGVAISKETRNISQWLIEQ